MFCSVFLVLTLESRHVAIGLLELEQKRMGSKYFFLLQLLTPKTEERLAALGRVLGPGAPDHLSFSRWVGCHSQTTPEPSQGACLHLVELTPGPHTYPPACLRFIPSAFSLAAAPGEGTPYTFPSRVPLAAVGPRLSARDSLLPYRFTISPATRGTKAPTQWPLSAAFPAWSQKALDYTCGSCTHTIPSSASEVTTIPWSFNKYLTRRHCACYILVEKNSRSRILRHSFPLPPIQRHCKRETGR